MTVDIKPIHPGEVLLEVYIKPASPELTVETLARALRVPKQFLDAFIRGRRSITPSLAMQLGVMCRTTPNYWLRLQKMYDLQVGKRSARQRRVGGTDSSHSTAAA